MKTIILTATLMFGFNAWAMLATTNDAQQSRGIQSYTIRDGYGTYVGHGPSKIAAASDARTQCVHHLEVAYEDGHQGTTPDPDTADLMIDACINK